MASAPARAPSNVPAMVSQYDSLKPAVPAALEVIRRGVGNLLLQESYQDSSILLPWQPQGEPVSSFRYQASPYQNKILTSALTCNMTKA